MGTSDRNLAVSLSFSKDRLHVTNLVNDAPYVVRMDGNDASAFKTKQVVFGSLVPWRGAWCWSGTQNIFGVVPAAKFKELRRQMQQQMPGIKFYPLCVKLTTRHLDKLTFPEAVLKPSCSNY